MEHHKISKLLNDSTISKFVKMKWVEVNDLSNGQCFVNKNITFKTLTLGSNQYVLMISLASLLSHI